jgi:hypothetical protein
VRRSVPRGFGGVCAAARAVETGSAPDLAPDLTSPGGCCFAAAPEFCDRLVMAPFSARRHLANPRLVIPQAASVVWGPW